IVALPSGGESCSRRTEQPQADRVVTCSGSVSFTELIRRTVVLMAYGFYTDVNHKVSGRTAFCGRSASLAL
ncbi:MAG: hypothetical protein QNL70_13815, partial [Pseudomonas sp.]